MRIFLLERISDIEAADAIIEDVDIILNSIANNPNIVKRTEKLILIPINKGEIKLKSFNYPFYIALVNTNGIPGGAVDKDYNIILYIKNATIHDMYHNVLAILNEKKTDIYHELNHIIDHFKSRGKIFNKLPSPKEDRRGYIDSESEFNTILREAFFSIVKKTEKEFEDFKQIYNTLDFNEVYASTADFLDEFTYIGNSNEFINAFIKNIIQLRKSANPKDYDLTDKQLKRIRKRGYAMYNNLQRKFIEKFNNMKR